MDKENSKIYQIGKNAAATLGIISLILTIVLGIREVFKDDKPGLILNCFTTTITAPKVRTDSLMLRNFLKIAGTKEDSVKINVYLKDIVTNSFFYFFWQFEIENTEDVAVKNSILEIPQISGYFRIMNTNPDYDSIFVERIPIPVIQPKSKLNICVWSRTYSERSFSETYDFLNKDIRLVVEDKGTYKINTQTILTGWKASVINSINFFSIWLLVSTSILLWTLISVTVRYVKFKKGKK